MFIYLQIEKNSKIKKHHMNQYDRLNLKQAMYVAVLDALVASRRWEPGEIVFHGGADLHIAYKSPRHSDDGLNFMITAPLNVLNLANTVRSKLGRPVWMPEDMDVVINKSYDDGNASTFVVTFKYREKINNLNLLRRI